MTMHPHGHSEHDSAKYVPRELLEEWKKKDPILYMETYLVGNQIAEKEELDSIDLRVKKEIEEAEAFAEESPYPEPEDVLKGLYATPAGE